MPRLRRRALSDGVADVPVSEPLNQLEVTLPAPVTEIEGQAPTSQRRKLATVLVPVFLALLLSAVSTFAVIQHLRPNPKPAITKAEWQPYIDAGTKVAVDIYSLDPQTIDTVVPRILGETTGKLHDQLSQNSDVLRQFVTTLGKTRQAVVTGAGLEALSRCCESPCGHACDNHPD